MIKYSLEDKNLVIELMVPELDHHITNEVRDGIDNILNTRPIKNIIFDFKNIRFMDSSGIGVIIGRYKKISNDGGKVSVINVNARVKKIFDLSGMISDAIGFLYEAMISFWQLIPFLNFPGILGVVLKKSHAHIFFFFLFMPLEVVS